MTRAEKRTGQPTQLSFDSLSANAADAAAGERANGTGHAEHAMQRPAGQMNGSTAAHFFLQSGVRQFTLDALLAQPTQTEVQNGHQTERQPIYEQQPDNPQPASAALAELPSS